ncbi:similar to Saccharomyces cerevisiae YPR176C BET2 Beta subunit of Type II geranylgeranyltransferase required for vesicular transport between the endoplasmic reticulum and the Golgi [Maudiozyma saulgeensis]|uniref:Geranylgeranyl transferase type-2 subunit beta n=1 Tax=Maudiozyma saulgeensis TaxID=1789683 RepID=A0A1X7R2A7_9SACH|nr:similar to Saccharomyces cerevisiae YPR176C BET2 Beta subunit of Type II geranylgeranyltransferase required for vesicular transport between the endoplasmic reticulum and the Golgi [Kazachstania saulgeensis]
MADLSLLREKHIKYIESLDKKKDDYEYWLSEHLRLNGVYWGLTALCIMDAKDAFTKDSVIEFVMSCWDSNRGGFGPFPRHDSHLLTTLSAIQILATYDSLNILEETEKLDKCTEFIIANQLQDGSFQGDRFGEVDTRFVYTALNALSILGKLTPEIVDPAVDFILKCYNFDGGFGLCPGAESHAAQAFTCLGALKIANKLDALTPKQIEETGWWLSERQIPGGGLNGRPSKLPDVCYSWWVLSSLAIIGKLDWIDYEGLRKFILEAQDKIKGGISDRPDNEVDVYHTVFGLAGLSLMGFYNLVPIDPTYCMPLSITKKFKKYPYESNN